MMFLENAQKIVSGLFFFIVAGCGLGSPTAGHDPNKPLPIVLSDRIMVLVNHTRGAIITTPDGKATLSIPQTALNADTFFGIKPYNFPPEIPSISFDQMYFFTPETISTLIPQQVLIVTVSYDPNLIPVGIQETDLRLAMYDPVKRCWSQVFLDSPSIVPGAILHHVTSKSVTQLGIFGVSTFTAPTCL